MPFTRNGTGDFFYELTEENLVGMTLYKIVDLIGLRLKLTIPPRMTRQMHDSRFDL